MLLRLAVHRLYFFVNESWTWNWFDFATISFLFQSVSAGFGSIWLCARLVAVRARIGLKWSRLDSLGAGFTSVLLRLNFDSNRLRLMAIRFDVALFIVTGSIRPPCVLHLVWVGCGAGRFRPCFCLGSGSHRTGLILVGSGLGPHQSKSASTFGLFGTALGAH